MADKKGKITLSGLTKGNSSSSFMPSFRFSPDSEAIEEIAYTPPTADTPGSSDCSAPPSPKSTGDTSPLKEYLRKEKHKWTNKWDKKSLSLDLDIKGKIITAIEDKRKSFFKKDDIPEEVKEIHTSQSIPENLTSAHTTTTLLKSSVSVDGDNSSNSFGKEKNNSQGSSGNGSQETLDGEPEIFKDETADQFVEEIGLDMTNNPDVTDLELGENGMSIIEQMTTFHIPPEDLQEIFNGLPTLYQPLSLISGVRTTPFELAGDETPSQDGVVQTASSDNTVKSLNRMGTSVRPHELQISSVIISILYDIVHHPFAMYWFALAAATFTLPFGPLGPLMWFLLGCTTVIVISRALSGLPEENDPQEEQTEDDTGSISAQTASSPKPIMATDLYNELKFPTKCQGWMTQIEGQYDVNTCHFRQTRVVYSKVDNHNLYLSYPNPKHRIPKRRLWNDPVIDRPFVFDKIKVFNISGASVTIVPDGLARKRIWNKKYPIAITFPKYSIYHDITPVRDEDQPKKESTGAAVNYNANTADVSVKTENEPETVEKEINRKDCGQMTIYLFARCDREKDDWFRRFTAATKLGTQSYSYLGKKPKETLIEYRAFMCKICPSLTPFAASREPDGFDNVSLPGESCGSKEKAVRDCKEKSSPSTSKKTTPDRENESSQVASLSDMENILSVPQSPAFLNALIGRLMYDFIKSFTGRQKIRELIDKKLFFMKKPAFIEGIHTKDLSLGDSLPVILRASPPILDHQGLWVDLDILYDGNFCVSLETRVNFLKLVTKKQTHDDDNTSVADSDLSAPGVIPTNSNKKKDATPTSTSKAPATTSTASTSRDAGTNASTPTGSMGLHVYDSDADDSGESSEDEHDNDINKLITFNPNSHHDPNVQPTKLMKLSEKIANSSFMNKSLVKKIVNNVAATPLVLAVELKGFCGTLSLNIPSPPNDRIWLGFRTNPDLQLVAKPLKFGDTNINISQVTEWIRRKLLLEFQRAIVCPNMVDLTIPIMEFNYPSNSKQ